MKVSILIPTLNRRRYLEDSLQSARAQTHAELEILISDDGSTDDTRDFVRQIEAVDARVRLLPPNPHPGLFTNVNYLVSRSAGDAFCILGDDDWLFSDFVEKLVRPLREDPGVVASFADHWVVDPEGRRLEASTDWNSKAYGRADLRTGPLGDPLSVAMHGSMCMGFSLYRSAVFAAQPFDLECGGAADFDYAIRAAQLGTLFYVGERLGAYRSHPTTATGTRPRYMIDGAIHVFQKHRFLNQEHEQIRLRILRERLRAKIGFVCTEDRREWWVSVAEYVRLGGSALDGRVLASAVLALAPRRLGQQVKHRARRARTVPTP